MRVVGAHLRANAIAYVALFFALSAGAYAVSKAPKNSVVSKSIKKGAVKSADIGNGEVKSPDIGKDAVESGNIAAAAVKAAHLDPGAIPDDGFEFVNVAPVTVDDPADGVINTDVTLLQRAPFTLAASCRDNGASASVSTRISSSELGHAVGLAVDPDDLQPNVAKPILNLGAGSGTDRTERTSGVTAYTASGRFLQATIFTVTKPQGYGANVDCMFWVSGFAN